MLQAAINTDLTILSAFDLHRCVNRIMRILSLFANHEMIAVPFENTADVGLRKPLFNFECGCLLIKITSYRAKTHKQFSIGQMGEVTAI